MKMETTAKLRNLRMSPRKVRLMTDLVKGLSVQDALLQLSLKPRISAQPVKKLLESAVANAEHNHSIDTNTLVVKNAFVDGGAVLKRFTPRAFGRASAIHKRTSHVTIVLEGEVNATKAKKQVTKNIETNVDESHEGHDHSHTEEAKSEKKKTPSKKTVKKEIK